MKKKLMYEVPDAELIELKLEGYLMQSGRDSAGYGFTTNVLEDLDDPEN